MALTPNQLSMLLSVHIRGDCTHGAVSVESLQYRECQQFLLQNDLAKIENETDNYWTLTAKGSAHVKGIVNVGLPQPQWVTVYPKL